MEDVAALLASVVDQPKAVNQVFNCATDRYVLRILNVCCEYANKQTVYAAWCRSSDRAPVHLHTLIHRSSLPSDNTNIANPGT